MWIDGEPVSEQLAIQAIRKIEKESHLSGLTDKIKEFLEKNGSKVVAREQSNEFESR